MQHLHTEGVVLVIVFICSHIYVCTHAPTYVPEHYVKERELMKINIRALHMHAGEVM